MPDKRKREIDLLREDIDPPTSNVSVLLRELSEQMTALLRRGA